jgi:hypothetical protein
MQSMLVVKKVKIKLSPYRPWRPLGPTVCKIHNFRINSKWEEAKELNLSTKNNNYYIVKLTY